MSPLILAGERGVRKILLFHFPDPYIYIYTDSQTVFCAAANQRVLYMQAIHIICEGDFNYIGLSVVLTPIDVRQAGRSM